MASAPVRICDIGGWTDTWFGGPGRILHVAVRPGVTVSICATDEAGPVVLSVENFGDRYRVVPRADRTARHPLLEAAVDALPLPSEVNVEISVRSDVPAGCGTGTSAAVAVALLGALAVLRSEQLSAREIAYAAHRLEVNVLGVESGIQDQLCAALGGINYLEIEAYPEADVTALPAWDALSHRLTLLFLGRSHDSSAIHRQVIEDVASRGSQMFSSLRDAAFAARDAAVARDLVEFGRAMIANTDAQAALHPALVGEDAQRVITAAAEHGALGWKVNGAGGDGGSLTLLSATPEAKVILEHHVAELDRRYQVVDVQISADGLEVRGAL